MAFSGHHDQLKINTVDDFEVLILKSSIGESKIQGLLPQESWNFTLRIDASNDETCLWGLFLEHLKERRAKKITTPIAHSDGEGPPGGFWVERRLILKFLTDDLKGTMHFKIKSIGRR